MKKYIIQGNINNADYTTTEWIVCYTNTEQRAKLIALNLQEQYNIIKAFAKKRFNLNGQYSEFWDYINEEMTRGLPEERITDDPYWEVIEVEEWL